MLRGRLAIVVATVLVAGACGSNGDQVIGIQTLTSGIARAPASGTSETDIARVADADTDLGFAIMARVADGGNAVLSPSSIATALGMLWAGARGPTADEIAHVLSADDPERYHSARNAVDLAITEIGQVPGEGDAEPFTLRSVNALFGQDGFAIEDEFLDLLALHYGAGMNIVDFVNETEASRVAINSWVEDQTENRIEDLIPPGVVNDLTRLVIANAIYFKANWLQQFEPSATATADFTTPRGPVSVDMMNGSVRAGYHDGEGFAAIALPYMGSRNSMLLIVPDDGSFDDIAGAMGSGMIRDVRTRLSEHQVQLSMPKFEFTTEVGLKSVLSALGMESAFVPPGPGDGADLTGIHAERVLYVQDALHKAFIAVDEQGTEAAAATAIVIGLESAPPPAELIVDRPFLFLIQDDATGEPVFVGQVTDPTVR